MERDPVRFVWRAAPGSNAVLVLLAVLALVGLGAGFELVRAAIDDVALGLPYVGGRNTAPLLRVAVPLPERVADGPLVVLRGIELTRPWLLGALLAGFGCLLAGAGILVAAARGTSDGVGRRAATSLTARMLEGIASAPISASDAARQSAEVAGRALLGQRRALGAAVGLPALAVPAVLLVFLYLAAIDLYLPLACLIGLAFYGAVRTWRERAEARLDAADAVRGEALRRALSALAGHLPALAAHGTGAAEQRRVADELLPSEEPARGAERWDAALSGLGAASAVSAPLSVLGVGAALAAGGTVSPGEAVAGAAAAGAAAAALRAFGRWRTAIGRIRPVFAELARQLGAFQARRRSGGGSALPADGSLVAEGVSTEASGRDGRLSSLDLAVALPSHVALVGGPGSGAGTFAALLGAQRTLRAGRLAFGDVDLAAADPADRAKRLAFAGGDTLLLPGTLRSNLLYGCPDADAPDIDDRLREAVGTAGLAELVYARGLAGTVDPRREPDLAGAIVDARGAVRTALEDAGRIGLIEPFDPDRYNPQATIGENILFGVPLGDTFRDEHLPAHSFMRGLLEREDLAKPLASLGADLARTTLEMLAGVPEGSPILGRIPILSGQDRDSYERLLERRERGGRGSAAGRDAERLIALALRYSENRHRLGLVGPDLEARLLRLRKAFGETVPKSLEPAVEFFRPDRLCAAASVGDNLLFGRVAEDRASARKDVGEVVRAVLAERGLADAIVRIGLGTRVDPDASGFSTGESAALDIARCLVRRPDNLVVERACHDLPGAAGRELSERLRAALRGRGLLVVLPPDADPSAFDTVVRFEAGRVSAGAPAAGEHVSAGQAAGAPA